MPKVTSPPNAIRPELLFTELNDGIVDEHDYLAQSVNILDNYSKNPDDHRLPNDEAIYWSDRQRIIDDDAKQNGYASFSDGSWYLASDVVFDEVTADMFMWWLNFCDDNEKFKWWHPKNHIQGGWDPQFYSVPCYERDPDYFVNHAHVMKHSVGNFRGRFHNDFIRAENYFDCTNFEERNVKHCVLARTHIFDPSYGDIAFGFLLYVLIERNGKMFLRTRLWLGAFEKISGGTWWFNRIANTKLFRKLYIKEAVTKALWQHLDEQSACLAAFLPKLYRKESQISRQRNSFEVRGYGESNARAANISKGTETRTTSGYFYGADEDEVHEDGKSDVDSVVPDNLDADAAAGDVEQGVRRGFASKK